MGWKKPFSTSGTRERLHSTARLRVHHLPWSGTRGSQTDGGGWWTRGAPAPFFQALHGTPPSPCSSWTGLSLDWHQTKGFTAFGYLEPLQLMVWKSDFFRGSVRFVRVPSYESGVKWRQSNWRRQLSQPHHTPTPSTVRWLKLNGKSFHELDFWFLPLHTICIIIKWENVYYQVVFFSLI